MSWMDQIGQLLQQYKGADPRQAPDTANDDFDRLAQNAPSAELADGLAAAFRSDQTPAFGQMVSQMFANGDGQQRASLLNHLIRALGPTILAQVLARKGGGGLAGLLGGGQQEVTPEQAEQVSPDEVALIAEQAEQKDPSIIDRVSDFYARQPALVKTLGAAALTIALAKIADRQYKG
jgi:hypothetical protein